MASQSKPEYLKKGDSIAIVASARKVTRIELQFAIDLFQSWGLDVILDELLFAKDFQFAGSDEIRIRNIQKNLDDPKVKALVFARGGYGSVRVIDSLNFNVIKENQKWLVGFSDVTVFHSHLNRNQISQTIHSTMPLSMPSNTGQSLDTLKSALFGELKGYTFKGAFSINEGKAHGALVGGNLSLLHSLAGSVSDLNYENKILFIEDLDEMIYHIDRILMWMKRTLIFSKISGLIVGGMSDMRDTTIEYGFKTDNPFGKDAKQLIAEHTKDYDFPVCFGLPFGHEDDNRAIYLGREIELRVNSNNVEIEYK